MLIFARNIKEAKRIGYGVMSSFIVDEYTDMAVRLLSESSFLFDQVPEWSKDKLTKGEAHVLDSPPSCKQCEMWGYELNENGICQSCEDDQS